MVDPPAGDQPRAGQLANTFHNEHGRPPTPAERQELHQQATLETREAKHEPRSRNEQRAVWWQQAVGLLGEYELQAMYRCVFDQQRPAAPSLDDAWYGRLAAMVISNVEEGRAEWQAWHVRAEAQRLARADGVRWDQLDEAIPRLVDTAVRACIPLVPPDDGIREPDALRRADGTSVYRVAGATRYTSQRILFAEHRIIAAAGQLGGRAADPNSVDTALLAEQAKRHRVEPRTGPARPRPRHLRPSRPTRVGARRDRQDHRHARPSHRLALQRRQCARPRPVRGRRLPARRGTRPGHPRRHPAQADLQDRPTPTRLLGARG